MVRSGARRRRGGDTHLPEGARRAEFPPYIEPSSPRSGQVPARGQWLCEIKQDGYRTQAHIRDDRLALYSRRGHDWSDRFGPIVQALRTVSAESAILDGEIVVPGEGGIADFRMLQADLAASRTDRLVYFVFDLLYVNGFDLRGCALEDRKALLAKLVAPGDARIRMSEQFQIKPEEMFQEACRLGFEGIVCKQLGSRYRSGETDDWIKVKCKKSETFPIIAFVEKLGANPRRIASLYLGRWEDSELLYAGKAETGFKQEMLYDLRERLDGHIRKTSPLSVPVKKPKATWVEPVVEAEIEYNNVTAGNILRMPVFKGIRDDLTKPLAAKPRHRTNSRPAVPRANILQLLPDASAPSKEQLAAYWQRVGKRALEYLGERPLKLVRNVNGTIYYHRGSLPPRPSTVRELRIKKREGGEGTRVWVDDVAGLLGLVEMGVVEVHPWNATVDNIELADTMVFDLDPGEGVAYDFVIETALRLRDHLEDEGYSCWPKLSGGKGVHLMVPLKRRMRHDAAHQRAKEIATALAATDRRRYTISAAMRERPGRLFIDYLRNGRGTTAVGTYSPRARPGFPLAVRVTWKQIEQGIRPDAFSIGDEL
jgi:bifunctional non-homologous end joining protein LigD